MRIPTCKKILYFLSFIFSIFSVTARAATITNSELPGTIQSCITATTCAVSDISYYDSGAVNAYQIFQSTGAGNPYEQNWLIRYSLSPPSGQSRINPSLTESFSGYLWMLAKGTYSTTEAAHSFTLYLDKVTPTPFSMFGQNGDISLSMTTADLLAGSSYRNYGLDGNYNGYDNGGLSGNLPSPCLAPTCQINAQLNLTQLMYGDTGAGGISFTSFNPTDTRSLIFTQSLSYSGLGDPSAAINDVQSFYVNAVPLPGALWLFGSGLAGLIGVIRLRQGQK